VLILLIEIHIGIQHYTFLSDTFNIECRVIDFEIIFLTIPFISFAFLHMFQISDRLIPIHIVFTMKNANINITAINLFTTFIQLLVLAVLIVLVIPDPSSPYHLCIIFELYLFTIGFRFLIVVVIVAVIVEIVLQYFILLLQTISIFKPYSLLTKLLILVLTLHIQTLNPLLLFDLFLLL